MLHYRCRMALFQHEPLDLVGNPIRLLRVRYGDTKIPECNVSVCDLDLLPTPHKTSCPFYGIPPQRNVSLLPNKTCLLCQTRVLSTNRPSYKALSYTWGARTPVKEIRLNDRTFLIRENLWDFLSQVSSSQERAIDGDTKHSDYYWIDQICIDQNSIKEKNHQVQRMGRIYREANGVVVWLGKSTAALDGDIRSIKASSELELGEFLSGLSFGLYGRFDGDTPEFGMLPYWSRLWVTQEFLLASTLILKCGDYVITWQALLSYYERWQKWGPRYHKPPKLYHATRLVQERIKYTTRLDSYTPSSLPRLVLDFSGAQCEDTRDHVFGLLGLLEGDSQIMVDYAKPATALFEEVLEMGKRTGARHLDLKELEIEMSVAYGTMTRNKKEPKQL
jgi:hypothetical protein